MKKPFYIAVVGGSYCGKSSFAKSLWEMLLSKYPSDVVLIEEKSYMETSAEQPNSQEYNYTALTQDLLSLRARVVIVEGFYLLSRPETRNLFQESVFIESSDEGRFDKKLKAEMGQDKNALDIYKEFHGFDKPLYDRFVAPSKAFASKIIQSADFLRELNKFAELLLLKL